MGKKREGNDGEATVTMLNRDGEEVTMSIDEFQKSVDHLKAADIELMDSWIKKVKLVKGEEVAIWTESEISPDNTVSSIFKSREEPHYNFREAMACLDNHVRMILEVPIDWAEEITVTSVIFSRHEKSGVMGAVIAGQAKLETAGSPFTFTTPHLPFEQYVDDGEMKLMPVETQVALTIVEGEARRFLNGRRAQGDMFAEAG